MFFLSVCYLVDNMMLSVYIPLHWPERQESTCTPSPRQGLPPRDGAGCEQLRALYCLQSASQVDHFDQGDHWPSNTARYLFYINYTKKDFLPGNLSLLISKGFIKEIYLGLYTNISPILSNVERI